MYMKVSGETVICIVSGQKLSISEQIVTYRNEGCDGAEAGQHPRLNRERNLWNMC